MRNVPRLVIAGSMGLMALLMAPRAAWTQESAVRKLVGEDYDRANNAADVAAKVRLYAVDAVMLPPQGPAVSGERAIRAWHEAIFREEISRIDSKVNEVQVFGDWGFASGTTSGTITSRATGQRRNVAEKWFVVVRRQADGTWKIVRDIWNEEPAPGKSS